MAFSIFTGIADSIVGLDRMVYLCCSTRHGSINTAAVLLYALTSCMMKGNVVLLRLTVEFVLFVVGIAGYVSSRMYKQIGGDSWVWNIVMTASLFSGIAIDCFVSIWNFNWHFFQFPFSLFGVLLILWLGTWVQHRLSHTRLLFCCC